MSLSNDYRSRGLEVVGVAMDEGGLEGVRRFVRKYDVPYPILLPGAPGAPLMPSVETLPTTFLIDKQGQLAALYSGAMEESVFRQDVEKLLAAR
jgi:peroxiredoxin